MAIGVTTVGILDAGAKGRSTPSKLVHFLVYAGARSRALKGVVQLFGIESPGLTASLAIADYVKGLLVD